MASSNHLLNQTSPYLLQHAHNPVEWYPWGREALEKAAAENKPILLSIGYSACHWCHVMAHESFEDEQTAKLMNQLFVNIKVDREERPDLDNIYQTAHHMLTQRSGGWPLTVFLDPHHHLPFFAGTYFPKESGYGLPVFKDLLLKIAQFYTENHHSIQTEAPSILNTFQNFNKTSFLPAETPDLELWEDAVKQLAAEYDPVYGGFGTHPKFPNPPNFELLMRDAILKNNTDIINNPSFLMLKTTLTKMALGGIYDQISGGFYRYSVDAKWEIPHFEKMLYDNAQLIYHYTQVYSLAPDFLFKKVITETAEWIIQNMQSKEGGYFSSIDADSEGKEGVYYLWTTDEIKSSLNEEEYNVLSQNFNLRRSANFEGYWHLHISNTLESIAEESHQSFEQVENFFNSARLKLLKALEEREKPFLDDKVLTSWNALMIKGMATAGEKLSQSEWLDSAERALAFIHQNMWKKGRLLATWRNGTAQLPAYLDDYAYLLDAILTLLTSRWQTKWLIFAQELADVLLKHFADSEHGNFFFVSDEHEQLLYRPKVLTDNVMPSGSGIACYALQRLGYLLGEDSYLNIVSKSLKSAWPIMKNYSAMYTSLLLTSQEHLNPPRIIIIRGEKDELLKWNISMQQKKRLTDIILSIPNQETNLPYILAQKVPSQMGSPMAYICEGKHCLPPVNKLTDLMEILDK